MVGIVCGYTGVDGNPECSVFIEDIELGNGGDDGEKMNRFDMRAVVNAVSEKIEVEVIEAEYASGIYWVITSDSTVFLDRNGNEIKKSDIKAGDVVEITYNGQVMMSYPPQIVALKIKVLGY